MTSPPDDQERLSVLEETVERLTAIVYLLNARVSDVENKDAIASPSAEAVTTIKGAAYATGFSESQIRKMIEDGRIKSRRRGGRVLIDIGSLPVRRECENAH
jgi:hypothetical protein